MNANNLPNPEDYDEDGSPSDKVAFAKELIKAAIEILQDTLKSVNREDVSFNTAYYKAYILDHLEILASSEHGFLSRDTNLDDLIEKLEEWEEEQDKEEAQRRPGARPE